MSISDEALKRAFIETQVKLQNSTRQLSTVRAQQSAREREKRILELSAKELKGLPPGTAAYRSVGKAFMKENLSELFHELDAKGEDARKEIDALKRAASKMERDAMDAEKGLKEILGRRT